MENLASQHQDNLVLQIHVQKWMHLAHIRAQYKNLHHLRNFIPFNNVKKICPPLEMPILKNHFCEVSIILFIDSPKKQGLK